MDYSLAACMAIAGSPLLLALAVAWFAEPAGQLLLDWQPLGWAVDYLVLWPVVWFGGEMLDAGRLIGVNTASLAGLKKTLRLGGGLLLIYLCLWLIAVPLVGQLAQRLPQLGIDPPSYSQVLRFLLGAGGALLLNTVRSRTRLARATDQR